MQLPNTHWQDRATIKLYVRRNLRGRTIAAFIACLLPALISWIFNLFPLDVGIVYLMVGDLLALPISVPLSVLSFVASVFVSDPMSTRVAAYYLHMGRNPKQMPSVLSVCDCFGPGYLRLVGGMLIPRVCKTIIALLPLAAIVLVPGMAQGIEATGGITVWELSDTAWLLLALSAPIGMFLELTFLMVPHALATETEGGAPVAVLHGLRVMRRHKMEMVVVFVSFLGWMLASAGLLFVMPLAVMIAPVMLLPYVHGTIAAYYLAYTGAGPVLGAAREEETDHDIQTNDDENR